MAVLLRNVLPRTTRRRRLRMRLDRVARFMKRSTRIASRPYSTGVWIDVENDHRVPAGFGRPAHGIG